MSLHSLILSLCHALHGIHPPCTGDCADFHHCIPSHTCGDAGQNGSFDTILTSRSRTTLLMDAAPFLTNDQLEEGPWVGTSVDCEPPTTAPVPSQTAPAS